MITTDGPGARSATVTVCHGASQAMLLSAGETVRDRDDQQEDTEAQAH